MRCYERCDDVGQTISPCGGAHCRADRQRQEFDPVALLELAQSVALLSMLLARTIAGPVRRLAEGAEIVRLAGVAKHEGEIERKLAQIEKLRTDAAAKQQDMATKIKMGSGCGTWIKTLTIPYPKTPARNFELAFFLFLFIRYELHGYGIDTVADIFGSEFFVYKDMAEMGAACVASAGAKLIPLRLWTADDFAVYQSNDYLIQGGY